MTAKKAEKQNQKKKTRIECIKITIKEEQQDSCSHSGLSTAARLSLYFTSSAAIKTYTELGITSEGTSQVKVHYTPEKNNTTLA